MLSQIAIRIIAVCLLAVLGSPPVLCAADVSYKDRIAPLLNKYCAGCHNGQEQEGGLALHALDGLRKGGDSGNLYDEQEPRKSLLLERVTTDSELRMPPEGEPAPSSAEIELLRQWIMEGMPAGPGDASMEVEVPKLPIAPKESHRVTAVCATRNGTALGGLGYVELRDDGGSQLWKIQGLQGKVNALRLSPDGSTLVAGGGFTGLVGEVVLIDCDTGKIKTKFEGHTDTVYCAALSRDGRTVATGSYDRTVILWDVATGQQIRQLTGHNGAIYDLDFDIQGELLATASADQTVKIWQVASGMRLDTFGQPEGEMRCVRFGPDGKYVFAAGADRQIRKWRITSRSEPSINPMLVSRYAHESSVDQFGFLEGKLITASADKTVKIWGLENLEPLGTLAELSDVPVGICVYESQDSKPSGRNASLASVVWDLQGSRTRILREQISATVDSVADSKSRPISQAPTRTAQEAIVLEEVEPNDALSQALSMTLPAKVSGVIHAPDGAHGESLADVDVYQFEAKVGESWVFEVTTDKNSGLDSFIDILDEDGDPVVRTRLQALRESYFTFRGKDSSTSDDFRLHKWEDMELDEYLYAGGEVSRLWLYPRGPDSGFKVYPGFGKRYSFFGTTAISHALGDTAYVVRELATDEQPLPNGLPMFPIYYENDDDGLRRKGKDSRLEFSPPRDGTYFLRVRDARGFGGEEFRYQLSIRSPEPSFSIAVSQNRMELPLGSGREWNVTATRNDGLTEPIEIAIKGLPEGFLATNPLIIEAGQVKASGVVYATDAAAQAFEALQPNADDGEGNEWLELKLVARCKTGEKEIVQPLKDRLQIKFAGQKEVGIEVLSTTADSAPIEELVIRPGETISAKIVLQRNGEKARVGFGKDDAGRNLPHGAYVDNIGLNGLLIPEQYSEREFFITAAPKLKPGRRQFHLRAETNGKPTSRPLWLNVLPLGSDSPQ